MSACFRASLQSVSDLEIIACIGWKPFAVQLMEGWRGKFTAIGCVSPKGGYGL